MSDGSTIEWLNHLPGYKPATWNPVSGCTKVSAGCAHCYAEAIAKRWWGERKFSDVRCHPERLDAPAHWKATRIVFVNSMSDLFHESVPFEFIKQVFTTMLKAPQHIFILLTKRPARMLEALDYLQLGTLPFWLGVTVEDQRASDERIPLLLQTPAAVRWVSVEPILEEIDINKAIFGHPRKATDPCPPNFSWVKGYGIGWVVCGAESGPHARQFDEDWVRSLRDQCEGAQVPFFLKQSTQGGKLVHMPYLDGKQWLEYPSYVTRPA